VLLGGLIGVGVGLLLAPAAGEDTRQKLRERATLARDQALQAAEDARAKAEDLQNTGREMIEENKRRIARTAEAVKQSAQEAWTSPTNGEPANPTPVAPERGSSMYNLTGQTSTGGASANKPSTH